MEAYANKDSPTFTGTPKAPTAVAFTNTTQIATTTFARNAGIPHVATCTFTIPQGTPVKWYRIAQFNVSYIKCLMFIRVYGASGSERNLTLLFENYYSGNGPVINVISDTVGWNNKLFAIRLVGTATTGFGVAVDMQIDATSAAAQGIAVDFYLTAPSSIPTTLTESTDSTGTVSELRLNQSGTATTGSYTGNGYYPVSDNKTDIGANDLRFRNIYAGTGTIQTSDERLKTAIQSLNPAKIADFIMSLNPASFEFMDTDKDESERRTHYGLIAQDVLRAMLDNNMGTLDFAGLIISPVYERIQDTDTDGNPILNEIEYEDSEGKTQKAKTPRMKTVIKDSVYGLRYEEFIAPMLSMLQSQQIRIKKLEEIINVL